MLRYKHATKVWASSVAIAAIACSLAISAPSPAWADELQDLQATLESTRASYDEATQRVSDLETQIAENTQKIDELEAQMPELKSRAREAARSLYKMNKNSAGLLDLILSSDDFNDFLSTLQYLGIVQSHNTDAIEELQDKQADMKQTQDLLNSQLVSAKREQEEAAHAKEAAEAAEKSFTEELAKKAQEEEAEREAALKEAQEDAGRSFKNNSGQDVSVETPSNTTPAGNNDVTPPVGDKEAFINQWAPRIDAYLAGSPMAGTGRIFAEAAYATGADPRFSPAISNVESSKGLYCFKPYNAWGWGSSSWSSWEEAIWAHVSGLARGYGGGHLTMAGARKYNPPHAELWYAKVAAEMNKI